MSGFSKFNLQFAFNNFLGGLVYKEISNFGYFKKLEKVKIKWE